MHGRARLAVQAPLAAVNAEDPLLGAQPPAPVLTGREALQVELVGQQPIPELRVVTVQIEGGVDQVRVVPVAPADRVGAPLRT